MGSTPALKIRCGTCGKETVYSTENKFRPFCSERCQMIDLGLWAQESYTIAGKSVEVEVNGNPATPSDNDENQDSE